MKVWCSNRLLLRTNPFLKSNLMDCMGWLSGWAKFWTTRKGGWPKTLKKEATTYLNDPLVWYIKYVSNNAAACWDLLNFLSLSQHASTRSIPDNHLSFWRHQDPRLNHCRFSLGTPATADSHLLIFQRRWFTSSDVAQLIHHFVSLVNVKEWIQRPSLISPVADGSGCACPSTG